MSHTPDRADRELRQAIPNHVGPILRIHQAAGESLRPDLDNDGQLADVIGAALTRSLAGEVALGASFRASDAW